MNTDDLLNRDKWQETEELLKRLEAQRARPERIKPVKEIVEEYRFFWIDKAAPRVTLAQLNQRHEEFYRRLS